MKTNQTTKAVIAQVLILASIFRQEKFESADKSTRERHPANHMHGEHMMNGLEPEDGE
jgi:hypothetical protein